MCFSTLGLCNAAKQKGGKSPKLFLNIFKHKSIWNAFYFTNLLCVLRGHELFPSACLEISCHFFHALVAAGMPGAAWLCCCLWQESSYQLLPLKCALQRGFVLFKSINPITLTAFSRLCFLRSCSASVVMPEHIPQDSSAVVFYSFVQWRCQVLLRCVILKKKKKGKDFYRYRNITCESQLLIEYIPQVPECCI